MTRDWSVLLVHETPEPGPGSAAELVTALHALVARIRAADARSRWFFERHHRLDPVVALWTRTTGPARTGAVRETTARQHRIRVRPGDVDADPAALSGAALDLAEAGSELALHVLRDGGVPGTHQVRFCAAHLRRLIAPVAAPQRAAFLFQCWQTWSAALTPEQRVDLVRQADRHLDDVLADARSNDALHSWAAWPHYLEAVHAITAAAAPEAPPVNYLLFDHARRTHLRIGIPEPVQALAARTLRTALQHGIEVPDHARVELALEGARP
ncbi:hypothetical protein [Saccharopolyspora hordei]|uniref:Thiopeptide-type bacteriocin biosynthesis domain-containing protein n=1 Tax=Saccharopolyspora hordei TaxID=1838 RepID=A0A853AMK8_9PSEU|nr:hypothetical protein [Saccharopolyspora hordei]NYI84319.1 hypothetical protein [Saccharopolyspora hordei]